MQIQNEEDYIVFNKNGKELRIPKQLFSDAEREPVILNSVFGIYKVIKIGQRKIIHE